MTRPSSVGGLVVAVITRVIVCGALLGIAVAIVAAMMLTKEEIRIEPRDDTGRTVVVFEPKLIPVRRQWSGFGTAVALDEASVPARVAATVTEVPHRIETGRSVASGEVIARLDESDFRRELERTTSTLGEIEAQLARLDVEAAAWGERVRLAEQDSAIARAEEARVRNAMERDAAKIRELEAAQQRAIAAERQGVMTREELDKIPSRRLGLQAMRDAQASAKRLAEQNIERCTIQSPFEGVLAEVSVNLGESVQPGTRIARIVSLKRIEVPILLPSASRSGICLGDEVILSDQSSSESSPGQVWLATVARISPNDDPGTRTTTIFAELDQDPGSAGALAPGRFLQGAVREAAPTPARMVLPRRAVRSDRVFVVAGGMLVRREVRPEFTLRATFAELGLPDTQWIALADPLPAGDLVVLDASRALAEGEKATPVTYQSRRTGESANAAPQPVTNSSRAVAPASAVAPATGAVR